MEQFKSVSVLQRWLQFIIDAYPPDTARFLRSEKDRFANPVGFVTSEEAEVIYDQLLNRMDPDSLSTALNEIISIRSVQDFSPSEAVGFIFLLKRAVREEFGGRIDANHMPGEMLELESRIDRVALLAFDIYTKCRERISEIRVKEMGAQRDVALMMLARANAAGEVEESV